MPTSPTMEHAQIHERIHEMEHAIRAKDIAALMEHYAPENVTFDLTPPTQVNGADAYRKNFEAWFASTRGSIDYQVHDARITVGEDVAFSHCLGHVQSTRTTGEKTDYWVRVTTGFQRKNGRWMVTHEHVSMPLDMATMKAVTELRS
jgi:uncharacterized protein (TIGR02246 family)